MTSITEQKGGLYLVLIEWDGENPPTKWYDRMHELAGRVRGDKTVSPVKRREGRGVIFQEGAILCGSESLARELAYVASVECGAGSVAFYDASYRELNMTRQDAEILQKIEASLGKRGPKPKEALYTITCLEEMKAYEVEVSRPIQCPNPLCSGLRINVRPGKQWLWADDGDFIVSLWLRTRFAGPHWEPVKLGGNRKPPAVDDIVIGKAKEKKLAASMNASGLVPVLDAMPRKQALEILDAIFVGRAYYDTDKRADARIQSAARYFAIGGSPVGLVLTETPEPDLFDASLMLGADVVAKLQRKIDKGAANG